MLDYVKRSELDVERERRIRAEADGDAYQRENTRLLEMLATQSERHHEEIATLLRHTAPIAQALGESPSGVGQSPNVPTTVEEAIWTPAHTLGDIWAKRDEIARLKRVNAQAVTSTTPDDELSDAERERVARI